MSSEPPEVKMVKKIVSQGKRQHVLIIPREYIDSGAIDPAYFYEVTFRRLKRTPPKLEKAKTETEK